jgi:ubiquinone/menaquinone biosynthesis C-methylase UbiE
VKEGRFKDMLFFNYSKIVDPWLKDVRILIPGFADIKAGDKVLDICCGTGDQAFYYAKLGASVYGIDLDPNMIRLAQKDQRNKDPNVSFRVADAANLPFDDASFDFVSVCLALHEIDEEMRNKTISEMRRVLKKGGFLICTDFKIPFSGKIIGAFITAIERFAGKKNFSCFQSYIKAGGLSNILAANGIKETEEFFLKKGNLVIIKGK